MKNESAKLKRLQTSKKEVEEEIKYLKEEQKKLTLKINESIYNLENINIEIEKIKSKDILISEHAIVRYFERILKFDIEEFKKKILNENFLMQYSKLGNGTYPILGENFKVVIKNGIIITILENI